MCYEKKIYFAAGWTVLQLAVSYDSCAVSLLVFYLDDPRTAERTI